MSELFTFRNDRVKIAMIVYEFYNNNFAEKLPRDFIEKIKKNPLSVPTECLFFQQNIFIRIDSPLFVFIKLYRILQF